MAVDIARNHLALEFQRSDADYLVFIDCDAGWQPGTIERLVERDVPMVCASFFTKTFPPKPTIGHFIGVTRSGKHVYRFTDSLKRMIAKVKAHGLDHNTCQNDMVLPTQDDDLMEIDGCGMHFTVIRRDVIEAIKEPRFLHLGLTGAGEDFFFCRQVRQKGFPIYCDTSVYVSHLAGEDIAVGIKDLMYIVQFLPDEYWEDKIVERDGTIELG